MENCQDKLTYIKNYQFKDCCMKVGLTKSQKIILYLRSFLTMSIRDQSSQLSPNSKDSIENPLSKIKP